MANVYNSSGSRVGTVYDDGDVYSSSDSRVGSVDDDTGHVYNASGSRVGRVDSSGGIWAGSDLESDMHRGYVGAYGHIYKGPAGDGRDVGQLSSEMTDAVAGGAALLLGLLN